MYRNPLRRRTHTLSDNNSRKMKKATRELAENLMRGDRLSLARAITLVESSNAVHRHEAQQLLDHVTQPHSRNQMQFPFPQSSSGVKNRDTVKGNAKSHPTAGPFGGRSIRLGIAGPPGAGKSTLIEALGTWLTKRQGQRVAVLTIDPSSTRTGGSILGDKTRMELLSRNPNAFVRASPSSGVLGGLAMYVHSFYPLARLFAFLLLRRGAEVFAHTSQYKPEHIL